MEVRSYREGDAEALGEVFHRSVREGAAARYDEAQRAAWSPAPKSGEGWAARLAGGGTVVVLEEDRPVGFMSMDDVGYVDLAFVLPEAMGRGLAATLYAVLEGRARAAGLTRLTTQASLLAEPFFARHGWVVTRRQEVEIGGALLKNAWMEKRLEARAA